MASRNVSDEDTSFTNYVPTTRDPGPWALVFTCIYSFAMVLCVLPLMIIIWRRKHLPSAQQIPPLSNTPSLHISTHSTSNHSSQDVTICDHAIQLDVIPSYKPISSIESNLNNKCDNCHFEVAVTLSIPDDHNMMMTDSSLIADNIEALSESEKVLAVNLSLDHCNSNTNPPVVPSCYCPAVIMIQNAMNSILDIIEIDEEAWNIVRLGLPLTLSSFMHALFDAIIIALIGHFVGTNHLTAYVVSRLLIEVTDSFMKGVTNAINTLSSHAIGLGKSYLAGQYVQLAIFLYVLMGTPLLGMWCFVMDPILKWMGFNAQVITIASHYTRIVVFHYLLEGIAEGLNALLDVSDHAVFGTIMDVFEGLFQCIIVGIVVSKKKYEIDLVVVGAIQLSVSVSFFLLTTCIASKRGWLSPFREGLCHSCAIKNLSAVKNLLRTAIPLALGSFLEYGEWEALTFLVAFLGPAEVATWGILSSIWDLFEAATEGLGEAAAIRVAYHLGRDDIHLAKLSSYKSLCFSFIVSILITSIFFICGADLTVWFTSDETLQHLLMDVVPIVGVGNISMVFGMVSWSLIGGQGRYGLSTLVTMICSWCITLPMAAILCIVWRVSLEGIVSAVIVGYSTSGMCLTYILVTSDWMLLSKNIRERNDCISDDESSVLSLQHDEV